MQIFSGGFGIQLIGWINKHSNFFDAGQQLMQQLQSLRPYFYIQRSNPGDIALRSVQARDKFCCNWVQAGLENNRDCCRCCLRCKSGDNATGCRNHVNPTTDKIGCQRWQAISLTTCPAIFDYYTSAFVIAHRAQALLECTYSDSKPLRQFASQISDHRHRRLLRVRRKRPSAAAPPTAAMNSRRLIRSPSRRGQATEVVWQGRGSWRFSD